MLSRSVIFFFSLFLCSSSFSQKVLVNVFVENKVAKPSSDTIYHNVSRLLSWKDFQGIPDDHQFGGAITSSGFAFDSDMKFERSTLYINIGVYTYFSKHGSWKKPDINSDYHLLHEQLHFDITRLGAQEFVKQIAKAHFTKDNYQEVLNSVFDKVFNENAALQEKYDKETQHSINHEKQLQWNERITAEIKKLD
jgi:hypothetical protein